MTDDGPFIFGPARVVAHHSDFYDTGAVIHFDSRPYRRHGEEIEAARTRQDDVRRLLDPGSVVRKALGEFD